MAKLEDLKSKVVNVDDIIEKFILDKEKSEDDALGKYEAISTMALLEYTHKIQIKYGQGVNYETAANTMEELGTDLLDAIYNANRLYSRTGMQIGARLLMDLLLAD